MPSAEAAVADGDAIAARPAPHGAPAQAFGLRLDLPFELPALARAPDEATPHQRRTNVLALGRERLKSVWGRDDRPEQLLVSRFAGGRPMLSIQHAPTFGYRIWAPGHGRYLVSADGATVLAAQPRNGWAWQRLFYAQVLPLAATLQGLEPLHASAVTLGGRAVAFVAASGTGKTSVAAHLVARGAMLVADDVVVVDAHGDAPVVHGGTRLMNIDAREYRSIDAEGRARLGEIAGGSQTLFVRAPELSPPAPLDAVFFLDRWSAPRDLAITVLEPPDPRLLLGSTFITYVRSAARLRRQLDLTAALAEGVRICRIDVPSSAAAIDVARAVEDYVKAGNAH
jgi:hypothetical protein